ncbi:hypothetical protein GCM10022280_19380 [Sphingomonas swuensis]|uniref:Apea-like HEPN domain-containing protein n=2 Tax=Sphingomonas swuensis TaxID=977800 RepID=A0ABP7T1A2_9SPHN
MKEVVLPPVVAELAWSLENDEAALAISRPQVMHFIEISKGQKIKPHDVLYASTSLLNKLTNKYREVLTGILLDEIRVGGRKHVILNTTGFLVSNLISSGFDRNFLIDCVEDQLLTKEITENAWDVVKQFTRQFSLTKKKFKVIYLVNRPLADILKVDSDWSIVEEEQLPEHAKKQIKDWGEVRPADMVIAQSEVAAADPFSATVQAFLALDQAKAITVLQVEQEENRHSDFSYVYLAKSARSGTALRMYHDVPGVKKVDSIVSGHSRRSSQKIISNLQKSFSESSRERIARAMATANVISESRQDEVSLISLWSTIEILLGDPPDFDSRISHFLKLLVPLVVVRYHRRIFAALHDQITVTYPKSFQAIVRKLKIETTGTSHTLFAKLMLLPEHEALRMEVIGLLGENPLLRHRLGRVQGQYRTPREALKTVQGHASRVEWHLNRIYRTRNTLVHAGENPPYTESLVQNTLEYFRSAVLNIIRVGSKSPCDADLDQVIAEIGFDWAIVQRHLTANQKESEFSNELVTAVFKEL